MRLTTLVMVTRPTFWEKDVVGREENREEMTEPTPSHTTPPESSLAVASRPMPPSMQPEMSPMVSTAVTRNMIRMERMAWRLNVGFTGRICGTENHFASAIRDQFTYQEAVKAFPSASTSSWGSRMPMTEATM